MTGRNDPCPCGSGKKYKKCHGPGDAATATPLVVRRQAGPPVLQGESLDAMRRSCQLAARILDEACARIEPGVTTNQINQWVHDLTLDAGAYPSPLNYPHPPTDPRNPIIAPRGFPKSTCTSVNDVVCHGIPDDTALMSGDIVNVDVTCTLDGYFGDTSRTVHVGETSAEARLVTETSRECLEAAIRCVRAGALFWEIGDAIQGLAESRGLSVVRDFTGHGIGRKFHSPPAVLHYRDSSMRFPMEEGQCFTIEPMINVGTHRVKVSAGDGWTARTNDGKLSAQFEHTVVVRAEGVEVLTRTA